MEHQYVLPYRWQQDETTGDKTDAWVFTALDTSCTDMDIAKALADGYISQAYHDALMLNKYGGDTPPQPEHWLSL